MTARQAAVVAEIENQRSMLATRAAQFAGEAAELRAQLDAAKAEAAAQKFRADDAEAKLAALEPAEPEPSAGDAHA